MESVPDGAEGEIARVLLAKDFYDVLDVADTFEAEDLRRAKRKLSLATHPDKQQHAAGANQAFLRVTEVGFQYAADRHLSHTSGKSSIIITADTVPARAFWSVRDTHFGPSQRTDCM